MQAITDQIRLDAKACDQRKIQQARRMSFNEKFLAGAELFEDACQCTLMGIRQQYPDFSKEEHQKELRRRIKLS